MKKTKHNSLTARQLFESRRKVFIMAEKMFMRVGEVAEELDISVPYAYKLIRKMNEELKKTGCIIISGRIDRKFFHERFYGTKDEAERSV